MAREQSPQLHLGIIFFHFHPSKPLNYRAGQVTTLPRTRDHVFVSQNCVMSIFVVAPPFRLQETSTFLINLSVTEALLNCHIVVVAKLNIVACPALLIIHM